MIIKTSYPFMKPPPSARLIRGHHLAQGLVGCWLMNEGGGLQVFDLSGNGNTGTLEGDTHFIPGKYGSCLAFDGNADRIDYGNVTQANFGTGDFSLLAWIYLNSIDVYHMIMAKPKYNTGYGWRIITDNRQQLANPLGNASGTTFFSANIWYFIVATRKNGIMQFYANGRVDGSPQTLADSYSNTSSLYMGARLNFEFPLNGFIDSPMIYNRALSASEIAEFYWGPFCMFERRARTALMSGYEVVAPPVGMAGAMTTNTGYWGY